MMDHRPHQQQQHNNEERTGIIPLLNNNANNSPDDERVEDDPHGSSEDCDDDDSSLSYYSDDNHIQEPFRVRLDCALSSSYDRHELFKVLPPVFQRKSSLSFVGKATYLSLFLAMFYLDRDRCSLDEVRQFWLDIANLLDVPKHLLKGASLTRLWGLQALSRYISDNNINGLEILHVCSSSGSVEFDQNEFKSLTADDWFTFVESEEDPALASSYLRSSRATEIRLATLCIEGLCTKLDDLLLKHSKLGMKCVKFLRSVIHQRTVGKHRKRSIEMRRDAASFMTSWKGSDRRYESFRGKRALNIIRNCCRQDFMFFESFLSSTSPLARNLHMQVLKSEYGGNSTSPSSDKNNDRYMSNERLDVDENSMLKDTSNDKFSRLSSSSEDTDDDAQLIPALHRVKRMRK